MKTKTKFYGDDATDFHDKKVPKVGSSYTCLAVILLDSILGCMKNIIHKCFKKESDDLENSSDNSNEE